MQASSTEDEMTSLRDQLSQTSLSVGQLKKVLACKSVECDHNSRRADQYESEVSTVF